MTDARNPRHPDQLYCNECQKWITPVEGVTAIWQRGYWWCAKHAEIWYWVDGEPIVGFPSKGKLVRQTLLHE